MNANDVESKYKWHVDQSPSEQTEYLRKLHRHMVCDSGKEWSNPECVALRARMVAS